LTVAIIINDEREFDYFRPIIECLSERGVEVILDDYNNDLASFRLTALFPRGITLHSLTDILWRDSPRFTCIITVRPCFYRGRPSILQIFSGLRLNYSLGTRCKTQEITSRPSRINILVGLLFFLCKLLIIWIRGSSVFVGIHADRKIKFPKGLDIGPRFSADILKYFDVALCHGIADRPYYDQTFGPDRVVSIGYPRYNEYLNDEPVGEKYAKLLCSRKKSSNRRLRLVWAPSISKYSVDPLQNVNEWMPHVLSLSHDFEICIRPHPTATPKIQKLAAIWRSHGVEVITEGSYPIGRLYAQSDFVLTDFGGTLYSAIYCGTLPILLEGSPYLAFKDTHDFTFEKHTRDQIPIISLINGREDDQAAHIKNCVEMFLSKAEQEIVDLRRAIFGDSPEQGLNELRRLLER
jgi:hypothetical protein